jgi:2',3'-cyclic-nucleotide 2'-phosphodiesterase (5'-nucleotidase family)
MNGDWIDGTGLAMDGDPSHIIPLLEKIPFDVVNTGNHELYRSTVVEYMTRPGGFIDWWGHRHLASNIILALTRQSLSNRYILLEGRNSNVLVFGFLYNLPNPSQIVIVAEVEKVVKEKWFRDALNTERFDSIMVMAHMAYDDPLVVVLLTEIRLYVGHDMPVQFVTGHTHYRRYMDLDPLSTSFEAGRYMDTVGFVSFPTKETASAAGKNASDLFQHVFIDANVKVLQETLGVEKLRTESGNELSTFIQRTRENMGLREHIGCTPRTYYLNRSMLEEDSLWKLYKDEIVPSQVDVDPRTKRAIFLGQGSWRYYVLRGKEPLEVDDIIAVSPFNEEPVVFLGKFPGLLCYY